MNVTEIVRELKMTKEEFFPLAVELGFDIGERAIKVDDQIAIKLITAIKSHNKQSRKKSLFADEKSVEKASKEDAAKIDADKKIVEVTDPITTKEFADVLGKQVTDVIAVLVRNGIMATINQNLDFETTTIIAEDLGFKTKLVEVSEDEDDKTRAAKLQDALDKDSAADLSKRPPIVVVMGHVDHGKTRLLDAIKKTNVVDEEAGGITQSIGAYKIEYNDRAVTFIDTPGHEAFTAMRSRGANVADLAILVVAADDGVKPQTIEAIEILEKAELPFVVAINKIDKPAADIEKVKKELSELNLIPEDWGGKTICAPISAKAGTNIDDLLDMVLLLADLNEESLLANANRDAVGTIIESRIDKDAGSVATVLVQTGTLKMGDIVDVGDVGGKIKSMRSWRGEQLKKAGPSTPVQFLGLKGAPKVGDILVSGDKSSLRKKKKKSYQSFGFAQTQTTAVDSGKKKLKIIIKADTLGSLEAIVESLNKRSYEVVEVDIVRKGLGNFTEKDIDQAVAGKALLFGFNVDMTPAAADYALGSATKAETFSIIYKLIERTEELLTEMLEPEVVYNKVGEAKILAIFRTTKKFTILGGRVQQGKIVKTGICKLARNGKVIGEGSIDQLQHNKENVKEVNTNNEFGMKLKTDSEVEEEDMLEIYETEELKRELVKING